MLVHGKLLGADRELLKDVVARHFGGAERQGREDGAETLHGGGLFGSGWGGKVTWKLEVSFRCQDDQERLDGGL